jgi:hypothetical protein
VCSSTTQKKKQAHKNHKQRSARYIGVGMRRGDRSILGEELCSSEVLSCGNTGGFLDPSLLRLQPLHPA